MRSCFLAIFLALPTFAQAEAEIETRANIEYARVDEQSLVLDIVAPKNLNEPRPALVLIHGGGWAAGNKEDFRFFANPAAKHGYVCVLIGYRFAPKYRFPIQVEDCQRAVRWVREHAADLRVNPDKLGAMGASAGGHLSMMLGTVDADDKLSDTNDPAPAAASAKVQAVVSLFGPTNLIGKYPEQSTAIVENFLGAKQDANPALYRRASPITYVDARDCPMLLFQGTRDLLVPYDQATQMATALTDANTHGRVEILLGAAHGWGGKEMDRTIRASLEFFDQRLRPGEKVDPLP